MSETSPEEAHGVTSRESIRRDAPGTEWWWRCAVCGMQSRPTTDGELEALFGPGTSALEAADFGWKEHVLAHYGEHAIGHP